MEFYVRSASIGSAGRQRQLRRALRAGLRCPEELAVGELVDPAVAEGIAAQQAPARQDRPPDRPELADRLHRVLRAGGVVAAAGRERRRDEALVEADGGDQQGGEEPFHDKRSSPGPTSSAQGGAQPILSLPLEQALDARAGDDHVVVPGLEAVGQLPEGLADGPLHLVAGHRLADLPADGETQTRALARLVVAAGEGVEDEESVATGVALAIDAVEVAAPGESAPTGIRAALRRQRLRGEPLAALLTPAPENRAAGAGTAPGPETMGPGSLALLRLIGPLHQESPGREGRGHGSIGRALRREIPFPVLAAFCTEVG